MVILAVWTMERIHLRKKLRFYIKLEMCNLIPESVQGLDTTKTIGTEDVIKGFTRIWTNLNLL